MDKLFCNTLKKYYAIETTKQCVILSLRRIISRTAPDGAKIKKGASRYVMRPFSSGCTRTATPYKTMQNYYGLRSLTTRPVP